MITCTILFAKKKFVTDFTDPERFRQSRVITCRMEAVVGGQYTYSQKKKKASRTLLY